MPWPDWLEPPDNTLLERLRALRLVLFDVDGVLTTGALFYGDDGQEYKAFHSRDGQGMKMLRQSGVELGILTGRTSSVVALRAANLGIAHVIQGADDKLAACQQLLAQLGLPFEALAFVGDDIVDLPVMRRAGLAATVADAHPLVRQAAHWQSRLGGGQGAARELCELIMAAQGRLDEQLEPYRQ